MKIFSAEQIRAWDAHTIAHEPIVAIDLMERAAAACTRWLLSHFEGQRPFFIFCGRGNNGGDGLAIARQLIDYGRDVSVFILDSGRGGAPDFLQNLTRLQRVTDRIELVDETFGAQLPEEAVIIDALFGTGLGGPLRENVTALVTQLNSLGNPIVSIDLPSGLLADARTEGPVIRATYTLSFAAPKLGLLLQENGPAVGALHLLDIGLSQDYYGHTQTPLHYFDALEARSRYRPRGRFAHKGSFGHALLAAGALGK
ncbi:MAG: NAD(P)H-hydrate epimerase, partial [Sphingobacteriales bacterium]